MMKNLLFLTALITLFLGCSSKNMVSIVQEEQGQNIINASGKKVLQTPVDKVYLYNEDFIKIQKDKKFGIVSYEGKMLLEPEYELISPLYNDYAVVIKQGQSGIVNKNMQMVVNPDFEQIKIEEHFFIVQKEGNSFCMNDKAEYLSEAYDHIYYFVDGFARVEKKGKFGFINTSCQEVIPTQYDYVSDFINGFAKVKMNNKVEYIDQQMNIITQEAFKDGYFFQGK